MSQFKINTDEYYTTCTICGANLDPGEKCDCKKYKEDV